jgi:hypothetical protein
VKSAKPCHKCNRKSEHKLVDKWYCAKCYSELVEQKIKHNLRRYSIKKDSRLLVSDKASKYIVEKVINLPVKIVGKGKADYKILPWTTDDENEVLLREFLENKKMPKEDKKTVKLFYPLSKKEMESYFRGKKIPYKAERSEIDTILDAFEEKYPGTKASLLRSSESIRALR